MACKGQNRPGRAQAEVPSVFLQTRTQSFERPTSREAETEGNRAERSEALREDRRAVGLREERTRIGGRDKGVRQASRPPNRDTL